MRVSSDFGFGDSELGLKSVLMICYHVPIKANFCSHIPQITPNFGVLYLKRHMPSKLKFVAKKFEICGQKIRQIENDNFNFTKKNFVLSFDRKSEKTHKSQKIR